MEHTYSIPKDQEILGETEDFTNHYIFKWYKGHCIWIYLSRLWWYINNNILIILQRITNVDSKETFIQVTILNHKIYS